MKDGNVLLYPKYCPAFQPNCVLCGMHLGHMISETLYKTTFELGSNCLLDVYHHGFEPNRALRDWLIEGKAKRLRPILYSGKADGHAYDVYPLLHARSHEWPALDSEMKKAAVMDELASILELEELGFCLPVITPVSLQLDSQHAAVLSDLEHAKPISETRLESNHSLYDPKYAAPELQGGSFSSSSCLYSYGLILRDRESTADTPCTELDGLIAQMLNENPAQRPTASELIAALSPVPLHTKDDVLNELMDIIRRADPMLAARLLGSAATEMQDPDQIDAFYRALEVVPRSRNNINITDISTDNIENAIGFGVITQLPAEARFENGRPRCVLPPKVHYIFRESDLREWEQTKKMQHDMEIERNKKIRNGILIGVGAIVLLPFVLLPLVACLFDGD